MQKYVVGFLIDADWNVVLIRKNKPDWQAGRLNGVGGKIEDGEEPMKAMEREFAEEAGVIFKKWNHFATISEEGDYEVYCFKAFVPDVKEIETKSMTSELIEVHPIKFLRGAGILPSAMWLIQIALDDNTKGIKIIC